MRGRYGIIAEKSGQLHYLFLGQGREISALGYRLHVSRPGTDAGVALWQEDGHSMVSATQPASQSWRSGCKLAGTPRCHHRRQAYSDPVPKDVCRGQDFGVRSPVDGNNRYSVITEPA